MENARRCQNCGRGFMPNRADHHFCTDACRAENERQSGQWRERYHDDCDERYWHTCEFCGREFSQSGYTERGGQRRRRFCSDYCRGAYHRGAKNSQKARQKAWQSGQGTNWGYGQKSGYQGPPHTPPPPPRARFDPWKILGVKMGASKAEIKRAYRALAKQHHPDLNHDPDAEARMKDINRAYDEIGR